MTDPIKTSLRDLEPADFSAWRAHPVSRLLLDHLQVEMQCAQINVPIHVRSQQAHEATVVSGGLAALESLWSLLHPPEKPPAPVEEPFIDPALRDD